MYQFHFSLWKRSLLLLSLLALSMLAAACGGSLPTVEQPSQTETPTTAVVTTTPTGSGAEATPTVPTAQYMGHNLIINGDAEARPGATSPETVIKNIPGWTTTGTFTTVAYESFSGTLQSSDPGPNSRGHNYFAGGHDSAPNAIATGVQTIDLAPLALLTDTGKVSYTLSGYLGGYGSFSNAADVKIQFLGTSQQELGTAVIGPVQSQDRMIGNVTHETGLKQRTATGTIPAGTRQVKVTLTIKPYSQNSDENGPYNDGFADNLSLVLR